MESPFFICIKRFFAADNTPAPSASDAARKYYTETEKAMKRAAAVLLSLVCAALVLTGCANGRKEKETTKMTTAATTAATTTAAATTKATTRETTRETTSTQPEMTSDMPAVTSDMPVTEGATENPGTGTGETGPASGSEMPEATGGIGGSGN